jgi:hypothetical protein
LSLPSKKGFGIKRSGTIAGWKLLISMHLSQVGDKFVGPEHGNQVLKKS